jgi:hypothetical protein
VFSQVHKTFLTLTKLSDAATANIRMFGGADLRNYKTLPLR